MNIDKTQYKQDAKGNLVPLANIKEIDLLRDELVLEIAAKARAVQDDLITFNREAMDDIAAFVQLSADRYDVNVGGKKAHLRNGSKVSIAGFGTFEAQRKPERQGRNPQTGKPLTIAARKTPKFRPGKALKKAVNP